LPTTGHVWTLSLGAGISSALPVADPACQSAVQGVDRDGQDERPGHEGDEGREDLVAERPQQADERGADQHVEQARRGAPLERGIDRHGLAHGRHATAIPETV
jgi:hypothetical protein